MDIADYLGKETLERLVDTFSCNGLLDVRILSPEGKVLASPSKVPVGEDTLTGRGGDAAVGLDTPAEAEMFISGEHVGTIALLGFNNPRPDSSNMPAVKVSRRAVAAGKQVSISPMVWVELMRDVVVRLCDLSRQVRSRVEELSAMYRMTNAFTERKDIKEIYQLVAETMVKVTGTDACSIRVFNEERTELVVMAAYGLSAKYMSKGPILLSQSRIDREVVEGKKCVYVADERNDERVLYKAQARREGLVSALCAPMIYRGQIEGVIHVYTRRPHQFDWFETSMIQGVASQAAWAIVNARLYHEAVQAESIRRQLRLAGDVQRRMIPSQAPTIPGFEISTIYVPCFDLAGDFYDFIELPGRRVGLCVADVVGKGVRASLLMASTRSVLRVHANYLHDLPDLLKAVNLDIWRESEVGDFVTLFYGVIDPARKTLTYANAGHEPALYIHDGEIHRLDEGGGVIGISENAEFSQGNVVLNRGDVLIIFTDGLPEAINFHDELFGRERIYAAALDAWGRNESADGIGKHLLWEMRRFTGLQRLGDDLTLITIKLQ